MGDNEIWGDKNEGESLVILIAIAMQRYDAGHILPIDHIRGFTRSHWMPPLGKCLHRIAPVAAVIKEVVETTQNTNKTQLLASN